LRADQACEYRPGLPADYRPGLPVDLDAGLTTEIDAYPSPDQPDQPDGLLGRLSLGQGLDVRLADFVLAPFDQTLMNWDNTPEI
jgi:hypothetical protein